VKRKASFTEQFVGGAEFQVLNTEQSVARGDPRTSTGAKRRERSNLQTAQGAKWRAPSKIGGQHRAYDVKCGAIRVKQRKAKCRARSNS